MLQAFPFPIRTECPPGLCECGRERLLGDPAADLRILRLTREEEKRLIERIEAITSYEQLQRLRERLKDNLGVTLQITPSARGVRTVRGLAIQLEQAPGLCRKTRAAVPSAVRRVLDQHPTIVYDLLNALDLLGDA